MSRRFGLVALRRARLRRPMGTTVAALALALTLASTFAAASVAQDGAGGRRSLHDTRDLGPSELDLYGDSELDLTTDPVARALVDRARAALCAQAPRMLDASCEGDEPVLIRPARVLAGPAGPLQSHMVRLEVRAPGLGGEVTFFHVADGSRSLFGDVQWSLTSGMGGVSTDVGIGRWEWVDAAEPALAMRLDSHWNDEDMGICERDGSYESDLFVCVPRVDGPRCGHVFTRSLGYDEAERPCDDMHPRLTSRFRGFEAEPRFSASGLSFTRRRGTPERLPPGLRRSIPVEAFVSGPSTRWPSLER